MDWVGCEETDTNVAELVSERETYLPPLLSSLKEANCSSQLLGTVNTCIKYLSTYSGLEVEKEFLRYVVPVVSRSLSKIYEENVSISDTVSEEFVVKVLKDNLQVSVGFVQVIKAILEFLCKHNPINLYHLNNTPITLVQSISCTFEHCKNSSEEYKGIVNNELLELFRVGQETHILFIRLFERCIKIEASNVEEVDILSQVLDAICSMGETLSQLNIKSMSDNWKGYMAIVQKFSEILPTNINLGIPISFLTCGINRNLSSIESQGDNVGLVSQIIKITSFLIKVGLKICNIFWDCLEKISGEFSKFCYTTYNYSVDLYRTQGHSVENLALLNDCIVTVIQPLISNLIQDQALLQKILTAEGSGPEKIHFGRLNFLNNVLKALVLNHTKDAQLVIVKVTSDMFSIINLCFAEFFFDSDPMEGIFDSLVLNVSAAVITYDESYALVEKILIKNLLGDNFFNALLAMEVWTLVLSNSSQQFRLRTLTNLLQICHEINLGILTQRPEQIFLKSFLQRLFNLLPDHTKNEFVLQNNPFIKLGWWKLLQFNNYPLQQRLYIARIAIAAVEKIEVMARGNVSYKEIVELAETLDMLSTVDFNQLGLNHEPLDKAVYSLWEFNCFSGNITENQMFQYFFGKLCRITKQLLPEFTDPQLMMVLSQVRHLSDHIAYQLPICNVLTALNNVIKSHHQARLKLLPLTIGVTEKLLNSNCNIVTENTLEILQKYSTNQNSDVVNNIHIMLKVNVSKYLEKDVTKLKFDKEYFTLLSKHYFEHRCIKWLNSDIETNRHPVEAMDTSNFLTVQNQPPIEKRTLKISKDARKIVRRKNSVDNYTEENGVSDVLSNIKGEIKCLAKVLKTEKLSAKNANDLKQLANQLLSFL